METRVLSCDISSITFSEDGAVSISSPETQSALRAASDILTQEKKCVVFPTETVYGLGASALDPAAVSLIYTTKGRPSDNPLIVHISSKAMLRTLLPASYIIPPTYVKLMDAFWPGPLTLLFPANPDVIPRTVTAGHPTVAVRMPSHPVARALIALAQTPLAAPSANASGKPSPTRAAHVAADLGGRVPLILDGGACAVGLESTVIDGLGADGHVRVLRPGGVTVEDLERVLYDVDDDATGGATRVLVHRRDYTDTAQEATPTTPGMKYRHYAPTSPVVLLMTSLPGPRPSAEGRPDAVEVLPLSQAISTLVGQLPAAAAASESSASAATGGAAAGPRRLKIGLLSCPDSALTGALCAPEYAHWITDGEGKGPRVRVEWVRRSLGALAEPSVTARVLFDGLISLDGSGVDVILVEGVEEAREGLAVMNRMRKAAGATVWVRV